ncbi:MAG TPA: hypothetical protein VFP89_04785 [Propionibacteriaceae bacterium]|nr:hypothetical protein [Propionibacteriaceae bacterium]
MSPSTVRRVLFLADKHPAAAPAGPVREAAVPGVGRVHPEQHLDLRHDPLPRAGLAVLILEDLVSRKRLAHIVSVEETSTQVELAFTAALDAEGLLAAVDARHDHGRVDLGDVDTRPILLAVSDNGPQMTSGSTREFLAMCAIAQHFGRPGTPPPTRPGSKASTGTSRPSTHTSSRSATRRPCEPSSASSATTTTTPSGCTPASATSPPTTNTPAAAKPSAKPAKPASKPPA